MKIPAGLLDAVRGLRAPGAEAELPSPARQGETPLDAFVRQNGQLHRWLAANRRAGFVERTGVINALPPDPRPVARPALAVTTLNLDTLRRRPDHEPLALVERALETGSDIVIAPEWLFLPGRDHGAFRAIIDRLQAMTRGWSGLLLPGTMALVDHRGRYRNLALAISDGHVVHTYAKREDGDDMAMARTLGSYGSPARWVPGERPGIFAWRDLRVGMEVCLDHSVGRLRCDISAEPGPPLALQLVTASGANANPSALAIGVGGLLVLADGLMGSDSRENGAYLRSERDLEQIAGEVISVQRGVSLGVTRAPAAG